MADLLAVRGLTVAFEWGGRTVPVVNDVSFTLARGETLGLVGESGSGKTLTALSLLRLVPPPGRIAAGRVEFDGRDLMSLDEQDMRQVRGARIGLVFQEPTTALDPVFTIGDQIAETLVAHGRGSWREARARAVELLAAVRVPDPARRAGDYPHQLSGGLRQRALIATALACGPSLLVADEPTTALDVTIQAEILDLLSDLTTRFELALLLVTHDLGVVAQRADRVAVMYAGRIVEQAPVRTLFREPKHPYTQGLLASIPGGPAGTRLRAIDGSVPAPDALGSGCAFAPRCPRRLAACETRVPDLVALGNGHDARCLLHES
jgi:oligopeptide/dipeptide ABC transporter ATP-binding protein